MNFKFPFSSFFFFSFTFSSIFFFSSNPFFEINGGEIFFFFFFFLDFSLDDHATRQSFFSLNFNFSFSFICLFCIKKSIFSFSLFLLFYLFSFRFGSFPQCILDTAVRILRTIPFPICSSFGNFLFFSLRKKESSVMHTFPCPLYFYPFSFFIFIFFFFFFSISHLPFFSYPILAFILRFVYFFSFSRDDIIDRLIFTFVICIVFFPFFHSNVYEISFFHLPF